MTVDTQHPDAPLLAACTAFVRLAFEADQFAKAGATWDDFKPYRAQLADRLSEHIDVIATWRATTLDGKLARERAVAIFNADYESLAPERLQPDWRRRLSYAVLRDNLTEDEANFGALKIAEIYEMTPNPWEELIATITTQ